MIFRQRNGNQLQKLLSPADFKKLGLQADYCGSNIVKISRNGKPLGQIRKSIGKFIWQSAETGEILLQAFTPQKILSGIAHRL